MKEGREAEEAGRNLSLKILLGTLMATLVPLRSRILFVSVLKNEKTIP